MQPQVSREEGQHKNAYRSREIAGQRKNMKRMDSK